MEDSFSFRRKFCDVTRLIFVKWSGELYKKYNKEFDITIYHRIEDHKVYEIPKDQYSIEDFSWDSGPYKGIKLIRVYNKTLGTTTHLYPTRDIIMEIPISLFDIFEDLEPTQDLYIEIVPQPK